MANLAESATWEAGIYQLEEEDLVLGGADGIDNVQAKQLANRTQYLKGLVEGLGTGKQDADPTLAAIAALVGAADKLLYFTGADTAALAAFTAFGRSIVAAADAAAVRGLINAATPGDIAAAVAALVNSSPAALDTLNELATALGNDPNFATTITNALALKAALASPTFTGTPAGPTAAPGTNTTQFSTTAFVQAAITALNIAAYAQLGVAQTFTKGQSGTEAALPATTGTLTFDFTLANNFSGQVTGNPTFGNGYTGPGAGKCLWFSIFIQQDAATLRNWAFATNWEYVGGSGAIPAQTQVLGAWDQIIGQVRGNGKISFFVRPDVKV